MGWQGSMPFASAGGGSVSSPFPASRSWLHGSFPLVTASSASTIAPLSPSLLPPSFACQLPCNYTGPTWIIQRNLPSQDPYHIKSPLSCKITSSHVLGTRIGTFGGGGALFCFSHWRWGCGWVSVSKELALPRRRA